MGGVPEAGEVIYTAGTTFPKDQPKGFYGALPPFLLEKMKHFQVGEWYIKPSPTELFDQEIYPIMRVSHTELDLTPLDD